MAPSGVTSEIYERLLEPADGQGGTDPDGAPPNLPSLVGRETEWEALRAAWRRAAAGEFLLVAVTGEAGIGKSRLCEELCAWVRQQGYPAAASRCYAAAGGLAYAPILELLRSDALAAKVESLSDPWLVELARLLPELLEGRPELAQPAPLADDWQRMRLLDAVSRAVLGAEGPILLAIDDMQWCDNETLDFLGYLLHSKPRAPLLLLTTARSEELDSEHPATALFRAADATGKSVNIELTRLDLKSASALARSASGGRLSDEAAARIYRETEGNPLFVVEWARAGLAQEAPGSDSRQELPPRVHSVIETRLSQLGADAQQLAALAATAGRSFSSGLLIRASSKDEEQVIAAIDELCVRRIFREIAESAYDFTHDKLREAAYRRIGSDRRRMLHRRIAQAIERLNPAELETMAGELAVHYERAGWGERAAAFYERAAQAAERVYSHERAIGLFGKALELLHGEPPGRQRDRRELALLTNAGSPLVAIKGYGAAEVRETYTRAWEICERLGAAPDPPVLRALALVALARGELTRSYELGEQLLEAGIREDDAMVRVEGNYVLGVTSAWLGELRRAREQLEGAIAEYVPARARVHLAIYSQDPKVVCMSRLAYVLHFLGEAEAAERTAAEAIALAEDLEQPFSLSYALNFATWLAIDSDEAARAHEHARRMAKLADEHKLGFIQPMGKILRGWSIAARGRVDEGVEMIRSGLADYVESGWTLYRPYGLSLLARVCLAAGRYQDAEAAASDALALSERIGQRSLEADLCLTAGEAMVAGSGDLEAAAEHFSRAHETARRQGAAPLVARASRSLARLQAQSVERPPERGRNGSRTPVELEPRP